MLRIYEQSSLNFHSPGEKKEEQPLSRCGLVSCAKICVDLQSKQNQPETHEQHRQNQLIPQRHPKSQQPINLHHLTE